MRLIDWPNGLKITAQEPLSGPRTVGSTSKQGLDGYVQTTAAPFGLWRWRFQFGAMRHTAFRRYRGWITALHGGANATRVEFCDPDTLNFVEAGLPYDPVDQPWSNGRGWSSGSYWGATAPLAGVADVAALGDSIIKLDDEFWGYNLGVGDWFGFTPLHFGLYTITEVLNPGEYRIWPPLRKAISATDEATLQPTLAMRLEDETSAAIPRSTPYAENLTVTMVEVLDYDVRDYFTE